jgi:hypothetical protein
MDKMLETNTPDISGPHPLLLDDSCVFLRRYSGTGGKPRGPGPESGNPPAPLRFTPQTPRVVFLALGLGVYCWIDLHHFMWF